MTTHFLTNGIASSSGVAIPQPLFTSALVGAHSVSAISLALVALLFLIPVGVLGIEDGNRAPMDVDQLSATRFGDSVREILCIHTTDDIFAVVSIRVPKDSSSTATTSGVGRENTSPRHRTAWATYRWRNQELHVEWSMETPDWIRVGGRRIELASGRVIYWDKRIMGQSNALNGPLPKVEISETGSTKRLDMLKKRIRTRFPAEAAWDHAAGLRLLRQRQMTGKRWPVVKGTVVDDETGQPIKKKVAIQRGGWHGDNFIRWSDHPNGSSITDHGDGTFEATLFEWMSRVVVDGYLPKMILEQLPNPDTDQLERVLRLTPGPVVSGRVLNHLGKPVVGASVYAIGPMGLNLRGGLEWHAIGNTRRTRATPVQTDNEGRFRGLHVQTDKRIAVSCKEFDVWPAQLAADQDEIEIRLPEPATLRIDFDIPGASKTATMQIEAVDLDSQWRSLSTSRIIEIVNGDITNLEAIPAGRYRVTRFAVPHWTPKGSDWLDQETVELKSGDVHVVNWNRQVPGAIVKGRMTWDDDVKDLMGVGFTVTRIVTKEHIERGNLTRNLDSQRVNLATGEFSTERLPIGAYTLVVQTTQRVGTNQEFFGNRRLAGTVLHNESFSFPFQVKGDVAVLDLGDIKLEPAKDPRSVALRKRDEKRAKSKKTD